MSASLVGSEMCIRDRLGADRGRLPRFLAALRAIRGRRQPPPDRPQGRQDCLLYTSDAADDM
eukprot:5144012-Alexandrium_andersonii.AAC.1